MVATKKVTSFDAKFKMKDMGAIHDVLGVDNMYTSQKIFFSKFHHILNMLLVLGRTLVLVSVYIDK